MKFRDNGGYSLALVLVVMLVLSAITTALFTVVKSNISSQARYTQKIQAQYEAQGRLEKVLAMLSQNQIVEHGNESECSEALKKAVKNVLAQEKDNRIQFPDSATDVRFEFKDENVDASMFNAPFSYDFKLVAESDDRKVTVTYELRLEGNISHSVSPDKISGLDNAIYLITSPVITHKMIDVHGVIADEGGENDALGS